MNIRGRCRIILGEVGTFSHLSLNCCYILIHACSDYKVRLVYFKTWHTIQNVNTSHENNLLVNTNNFLVMGPVKYSSFARSVIRMA